MKISFFGASVTAQKEGYVYNFKNLINQTNNYQIYQNGYGSMHMFDAGICYVNNIISYSPDICFIDWFSTGYLNNIKNFLPYLNTIIKKLNDNNIKIIFLYFPRKNFEDLRKIMYEESQNYLKELNIPFIDLKYEIEKNNIILDDILKDSVHTNNKGGQIYGDIVYKWFIKNLGNLKLCQVDIPKNKFYEIKNVKFDNPIIIYDDYEFKGSVSYFIIYLEKSPHSGIIYFNNKKIKIWDQWCYYTRKCLTLFPEFNNIGIIKISDEDFDKSSCKIKDFEWDKYKKKLIIHEIFYLGDLEIKY